MLGSELVEGDHLSVDGSFIAANASGRPHLAGATDGSGQMKSTVREYSANLEQENQIEELALNETR